MSGLGTDDGVRQALESALVKDDNPGVRIAAVEGLRNISSGDTRQVMERVSRYDSNEYIRAEARRALEVERVSVTHL